MSDTLPAKKGPTIIETGAEILAPDVSGMMSAEIDRQIATAKQYPRSIEVFRKNVFGLVTLNEDIAAACMFALPRGGKTIEGPSIRFAEIAISQWGNCRVASQIVGEDENYVKALGVFWDLQSNSAIGFEVRRSIRYGKEHQYKSGQRFDTDMIGVTGNAAASIALRNASLRGVPKAFWNDLYLEAVCCAKGDLETLANRRAKAVESFARFGVTPQQICATLGVAGIVEIGLDQLAQLRGFHTAITQEDRDPEEIFVPVGKTAQASAPQPPPSGKAPSAAGVSAGADAPKADGAREDDGSPPADKLTVAPGEQRIDIGKPERVILDTPAPPPPRAPGELEESVAGHLIDCKSLKDCDDVRDFFRDVLIKADPVERAQVEILIEDRKQALKAVASDFPGDW